MNQCQKSVDRTKFIQENCLLKKQLAAMKQNVSRMALQRTQDLFDSDFDEDIQASNKLKVDAANPIRRQMM
jgi:hypothetical protein